MKQTTGTDPLDTLNAFDGALGGSGAELLAETLFIPTQNPDYQHADVVLDLVMQLRTAGLRHAGLHIGFRAAHGSSTRSLVIPDFFVLHRRPGKADEEYRKAHHRWYAAELLALVGEVTSSHHEMDSGLKYRAYAEAGVPVYVLIHRKEGRAYAFSDPVQHEGDDGEASYKTTTEVKLGDPLPLPSPYPALDTSALLRG